MCFYEDGWTDDDDDFNFSFGSKFNSGKGLLNSKLQKCGLLFSFKALY